MDYDPSNPGTLQYLVGRHLDRMSEMLSKPDFNELGFDAMITWLGIFGRPVRTKMAEPKRKRFDLEWDAIQARKNGSPLAGVHRDDHLFACRMEESALLIELLVLEGILVRSALPTSTIFAEGSN